MQRTNTRKLQDAKARLSEVVRRAREDRPQQITVHGRKAVVVVDPERFEIRIKPVTKVTPEPTLAGFIDRSKKYRGARLRLPRFKADFPAKYDSIFDEDAQ